MTGDENATRGSKRIAKSPDGGWGWMVVFGSFMIHVITDGVTYSFGVFYDEFLTYFNEGKGPTAWILSILVGVTLCSGPISSYMVNRWGCRVVTIIGSILASACMVVSIIAKSIYVLYFTIGLGTGLGFGLIYLPAIVSVSMYFEKKRSLATGIAVCGSGFGTFVFAPVITKLLELFGWKYSMLIISAVVVTCAGFGALFRPLLPQDEEEHDLHALKPADANLNLKISSSRAEFYIPSGSVPYRSWSSIEIPKDYGSIAPYDPHFITSTKSESSAYTKKAPARYRRILQRPDIFYQRSLLNIPEFKHEVCTQTSHKNINGMLSLGLFQDGVFILFILSNFLTSIGFNVPYVYIVSRAKSLGLSGEKAGLLLSIIGIANTIGRIVLGYLSDKPWVNRLYIYNICLTLCGIATALSCFCQDFYSLVIYGSVFGFTIGAYVGLTSVILVDLLGLDKLTNAFGLLLLFQGIASLIGPPIAGELYDSLQSYDPGFYVAGGTIALSGLILFFIPCVQNLRKKKQLKAELNNIYKF